MGTLAAGRRPGAYTWARPTLNLRRSETMGSADFLMMLISLAAVTGAIAIGRRLVRRWACLFGALTERSLTARYKFRKPASS